MDSGKSSPLTFLTWPLLWELSPPALPHVLVPSLWLQGSFPDNTANICEENPTVLILDVFICAGRKTHRLLNDQHDWYAFVVKQISHQISSEDYYETRLPLYCSLYDSVSS
jgi:hypothetical protein